MKKLGVIGLSEGNGHPYSWSAIFNGYDNNFIHECPFPVIPDYLSKREYPTDFLGRLANVTHVWTQSKEISNKISKFSRIPYIVDTPEKMIGKVDGILLARDDADTHYELAKPFLEAGLYVFVDKPLSYNVEDAKRLFSLRKFKHQLFTCSSLRYAKELVLNKQEKNYKFVRGMTPKSWLKYGIHIIEPIIFLFPERGKLLKVENTGIGDVNLVTIKWDNLIASISAVGDSNVPISIELISNDSEQIIIEDTFFAFRASLTAFISVMNKEQDPIKDEEIFEIISIIEQGILTK